MLGNPKDGSFDQVHSEILFPPFSVAKLRAVEDFEITYLERVLKVSDGNISEAGRRAGLDRSNFRRLLRRYGIEPRKG